VPWHALRVPSESSHQQQPRVAVVTGAGSGIGAASALALAGDGWQVVLAGRRAPALADVCETVTEALREHGEDDITLVLARIRRR